MASIEFLKILNLFIGKYDISGISFSHQQILTQSSAALPEHLVWHHGDNSRQCVDKTMDVLHIEIEGGDGIGYGILCQLSCVIPSNFNHLLWVHFYWLIFEFGTSDCL